MAASRTGKGPGRSEAYRLEGSVGSNDSMGTPCEGRIDYFVKCFFITMNECIVKLCHVIFIGLVVCLVLHYII